MNIHEDRIKAIQFDYPEYIPMNVRLLPATWKKYRQELEKIVSRHPVLFEKRNNEDIDYDAVTGKYAEGTYTDAWGCVWRNIYHGMDAIVTEHPVPTREAVHTLRMPEKNEGLPHGFMYLRLTDLRGFEEAMVDFAEEPPELQMLNDIVLEYNLKQAKIMLDDLGEKQSIIYLGDDLGMQQSLPIHPEKWRRYLKPCYKKIFGIFKDASHYVYMHSDGHILEIIPDLIECGADIINPQVRANGLDGLVQQCKGKVCVDLDLDRQMFPFCTPEDIDDHVREAVEKLGSPEGGLWLSAEIADDVPLENIEAICTSLEKYRSYFKQ